MSNNIVATSTPPPPPRADLSSSHRAEKLGHRPAGTRPPLLPFAFELVTHAHVNAYIHTHTYTSFSLQSTAIPVHSLPSISVVFKRTRLKLFEHVWRRLKTFDDVWTSDFRFPWNGIWFFSFFFGGEDFAMREVCFDWEERKRYCERRKESVFVYIPWNITVEIIDCFVLLFEGNTRHCLNNKEMKWNK